jgi:hypothetical protein
MNHVARGFRNISVISVPYFTGDNMVEGRAHRSENSDLNLGIAWLISKRFMDSVSVG